MSNSSTPGHQSTWVPFGLHSEPEILDLPRLWQISDSALETNFGAQSVQHLVSSPLRHSFQCYAVIQVVGRTLKAVRLCQTALRALASKSWSQPGESATKAWLVGAKIQMIMNLPPLNSTFLQAQIVSEVLAASPGHMCAGLSSL